MFERFISAEGESQFVDNYLRVAMTPNRSVPGLDAQECELEIGSGLIAVDRVVCTVRPASVQA